MSEKRYYQPEIETMPYEEIRALQSEKLVKQVKHIYENVPCYRAKMDARCNGWCYFRTDRCHGNLYDRDRHKETQTIKIRG